MKMRVLIVDDEPLARRALSSLLDLEPDFEVIGECADGNSAVKAITRLEPDLVFLDVQMPGMDGFEVLESVAGVAGARSPAVIFVTAFDKFAVKAFDAAAVDYLLKPFRRERFQASLQRARSGLLARAPHTLASLAAGSERIVVKSGDRLVIIAFRELEYVRAAANYVRLHITGNEACAVRETIGAMESQLPRDRFVRVHRSYIVNLAEVRELYHVGGGEYLIALRGGRRLPVGPSYVHAVRDALSNAVPGSSGPSQ